MDAIVNKKFIFSILPVTIVSLRDKGQIGQGDRVTVTVLASRLLEHSLQGLEALHLEMLGPVGLLLIADMDEDTEVRHWLDIHGDSIDQSTHLNNSRDANML